MVLALSLALGGCDGVILEPGSSGGGGGGGGGAGGGGAIPGAMLTQDEVPVSAARRLSRAELDRTLFDLLGDSGRLGTAHLPEDEQEHAALFLHWPFDNDYAKQAADKVTVQAFETIADAAAASVVADPARRATIVPCEPSGAADVECFRTFVHDFGSLAFRRPLAADEVATFMQLQPYAEEAGDFWFGVQAVLRAILQSPDFLYRVEVGEAIEGADDVFRLNGFEIASRMSYLLWGSMPDAELFDAAATGELETADGRRAQALRMLEDARAREQIERFHALWLGFNQLPHDPETTEAMRRETRALLDRVIFDERRPYADLFTFDETFVDAALAERYGLTAPDGSEGWVSYGDTGRRGILSHGSVLSGFATGGDTSTTRRGLVVRERLLCTVIPPPPPTVNVDEAPETHCKSEFVETHQNGSCGGCHSLLDPIGWGLERYDLAGRYREHDDGKPECPIDGPGELVGVGEFEGPGELGALLTEQEEFDRCVATQLVRFALGREERAEDEGLIEELATAASGDWELLDLLVDVVASERFALTRRENTSGE